MEIRFLNDSVRVGTTLNMRKEISDYVRERVGRGTFDACAFTASADGIEATLMARSGTVSLKHKPDHWAAFWQETSGDIARGEVSGIAACRINDEFCDFWFSRSWWYIWMLLKNGDLSLYDIAEQYPILLTREPFASEIATQWASGALTKPKESSADRRNRWLLFSAVERIRIEDPSISQNAACRRACDALPHLVPARWSKDVEDQAQTLERTIRRMRDESNVLT